METKGVWVIDHCVQFWNQPGAFPSGPIARAGPVAKGAGVLPNRLGAVTLLKLLFLE